MNMKKYFSGFIGHKKRDHDDENELDLKNYRDQDSITSDKTPEINTKYQTPAQLEEDIENKQQNMNNLERSDKQQQNDDNKNMEKSNNSSKKSDKQTEKSEEKSGIIAEIEQKKQEIKIEMNQTKVEVGMCVEFAQSKYKCSILCGIIFSILFTTILIFALVFSIHQYSTIGDYNDEKSGQYKGISIADEEVSGENLNRIILGILISSSVLLFSLLVSIIVIFCTFYSKPSLLLVSKQNKQNSNKCRYFFLVYMTLVQFTWMVFSGFFIYRDHEFLGKYAKLKDDHSFSYKGLEYTSYCALYSYALLAIFYIHLYCAINKNKLEQQKLEEQNKSYK